MSIGTELAWVLGIVLGMVIALIAWARRKRRTTASNQAAIDEQGRQRRAAIARMTFILKD